MPAVAYTTMTCDGRVQISILSVAGSWLTFPTQAIEQAEFHPLIRPRKLISSHKEVSRSCQNVLMHLLKKRYADSES